MEYNGIKLTEVSESQFNFIHINLKVNEDA